MTILEQAAQVLHEEARAIEELSSRLDHNFVNAVNMILACKGRVVCTGMGKSGHIGPIVVKQAKSSVSCHPYVALVLN